MYVCQVAVKTMDRSEMWAVCWTEHALGGHGERNIYHVRLWVSETVAVANAKETKCCDGASLVAVVKVVSGPVDQLWIEPTTARDMSVDQLANGWYYAQCYTAVIGDEARKVCDWKRDDVHTEATARP